MGRDEYAYVLEYLPYGLVETKDRRPSAVILTESLSLLLASLKKNAVVEAGKKVYIGEEKRDEIHHIIKRITPDKLSGAGTQILKDMVHKAVQDNEKKYVEILNTLGPVNVRLHALELIPGLGKKMTQKMVEERQKKPFESYEDIDNRLQLSSGISHEIEQRILEEIGETDKYRIFT
jgi:putative nucleotide binding protein